MERKKTGFDLSSEDNRRIFSTAEHLKIETTRHSVQDAVFFIVRNRINQPVSEKLMEHLLGIRYPHEGFLERLQDDKSLIRQKYGLPNYEWTRENVSEYIHWLEDTAIKNSIEIASRGSHGRFFKKFSQAGACAYPGVIVNDINRGSFEMFFASAAFLEHELVHCLQKPGMPIELREYEAYAVGQDVDYLRQFGQFEAADYFWDSVWFSVRSWYKQKNSRPEWVDPRFYLKRDLPESWHSRIDLLIKQVKYSRK